MIDFGIFLTIKDVILSQSPNMAAFTAAALGLWIIFPVITLSQCWKTRASSGFKKILWSLVIILSWPFFAAGSVLFGLVRYASWRKLLPLLIIALLYNAVNAFTRSDNLSLVINNFMSAEIAQSPITDNIESESKKETLRLQIAQLREEGATAPEVAAKNAHLYTFLAALLDKGLNETEWEAWNKAFENRHKITLEQMKSYTEEYIRRLEANSAEHPPQDAEIQSPAQEQTAN